MCMYSRRDVIAVECWAFHSTTMACNSQGFWTPWWWLRLSGRNMLEWLNNNKLINPKLISEFCWFVLFFILSLYFWVANWDTKDSAPNDSKHCLTSICSYFLHEWNFDSLGLFVSKCLNCSTLSTELLSVFILCPPTCCLYQENESCVSSNRFYPPTSVHGVISQNVTFWPWMEQCFYFPARLASTYREVGNKSWTAV